ncbi:hypothetical protein AYO20_02013 [Fonsecaea nubica]|uniref:SP-RING-type domain-containing protein n=1 Tax=Fonsecaea nubica TaxID=856822 RepID=A0A178DAY7_9EURO|nr:hypothetical protein AYO20_02013 [Fonsecaea nubica]OAL38807.1 hypothetical protein AYO20_02013 [Fonsecaea nubica]
MADRGSHASSARTPKRSTRSYRWSPTPASGPFKDGFIEIKPRPNKTPARPASPAPSTTPSTILGTITGTRSIWSPDDQSRNAPPQDSCTPVSDLNSAHNDSRTIVPESPVDINRKPSALLPDHAPDNPSAEESMPTTGFMKPNTREGDRARIGTPTLSEADGVSSNSYSLQSPPPIRHVSIKSLLNSPSKTRSQQQPTSTGRTTKRKLDANGDEARSIRPSTASERLERSGQQLPTPQESPARPHVTLLSQQLESSLAAIATPESDQSADFNYGRIDMLREACQLNDQFFLLAHLICSNFMPTTFEFIGPLNLRKEHFDGLKSLRSILCGDIKSNNSDLSALFATFPYRREAIINDTAWQLHPVMAGVRSCLETFHTAFSTLKASLSREEVPPAPVQLMTELRLPSPVLRKAVFYHLYSSHADSSSMFREVFNLFSEETTKLVDMYTLQPAQLDVSESDSRDLVDAWRERYSQLKAQSLRPAGPHIASRFSTTPASHTTTAYFSSPSSSRSPERHLEPNQESSGGVELTATTQVPQSTISDTSIPSTAPEGEQRSMSSAQSSRVRPPTADSQHVVPPPRPSPSVERRATPSSTDILPNRASKARRRAPAVPRFVPSHTTAAASGRAPLHQARTLDQEHEDLADSGSNASTTTLYHFVDDAIVLQECIHTDSPVIQWQVHIPHNVWVRRASTLPEGQTGPREREAADGKLQFRLRSVAVDGRETPPFTPTQSDFHKRTSKWPMLASVVINGDVDVDLSDRQRSVGLALDVTDLLSEGDNQIEVVAYFHPTERDSHCMYLMAIELICVATYDEIKAMSTRLPAACVQKEILNSFETNQDGSEDHDLVVKPPSIYIDLIDPLTSSVWRTPTRSRECRHRECFDLEAFLSSHAAGVDKGGLTEDRCWKCPICSEDGHPKSLVIDGFLLDVRDTLERNNQLHARGIHVSNDGSWVPTFESPPSRDQP